MTTTAKTAATMAATNAAALTTLLTEAQTRAASAANQLAELGKSNAGAMLEAGTALGQGLKQTSEATLAEGLRTFSLLSEDLKELAAVRSSEDALKLQGKLARRNVELTFGLMTRNVEAFREMAAKALTPLSGRAKANLQALRTVA